MRRLIKISITALFLFVISLASLCDNKKYTCFVVTDDAGSFSYRFISEELQNKYGDIIRFIPIGAFGKRKWVSKNGIESLPAYLLFDKDEEIRRIEDCKDIDKLCKFFEENINPVRKKLSNGVKNDKTVFFLKSPELFITKDKHIDVYKINLFLSQYHKLSSFQKKALKELIRELRKRFRGYRSVEWLRDALKSEEILQKSVETYNLKRKAVSIVKIAPDVKTFYREIARWNDETIYPILLGDNKWSIKFIEAFQPEVVIHLKKYTEGVSPTNNLLNALYNSASKRKRPLKKTINEHAINRRFASKMNGKPIGMVIIDPAYSSAPAGVALAAARYQMVYLRAGYGGFDKKRSFKEADFIRKDIIEYLGKIGISYEGYGNDLDGLTLAIDLPFRYTSMETEPEAGVRAMDDFIVRKDSGFRWGAAGRLIGDERASIYRAMCSIFLFPCSALFFSRYSTSSKPWCLYDPDEAVDLFKQIMPVRDFHCADASLEKWKKINKSGNTAGMVFVNSSGGSHNWSVSAGRASSNDIVDSVPCEVYMIHSGSASRPLDKTSILGRWLEVGAYNYFGSMAEPLLEAFVTPDNIARELFAGFPLAIACRQRTGDYSYPWRLVFFGDPLSICPNNYKRVSPFPKLHFVTEEDENYLERYFSNIYKGEWGNLIEEYENSGNVPLDSNTCNAIILGYCKSQNVDKIIEILQNTEKYDLWSINQLLCIKLLLKKAEDASTNNKMKLNLLTLSYRISGEEATLEKICRGLIGSERGDFASILENFIKEESPLDISKVTSVFTKVLLTEFAASEEEISAFMSKMENLKGCEAVFSDFALAHYTKNPEMSTKIMERLIQKSSKKYRASSFAAFIYYLLEVKEYKKAITLLGKYKELVESNEDLKYCLTLLGIRSKPTGESIKNIDEYISRNPHSRYIEALKDERQLLKQQKPKRKLLPVQLHNRSDILIDGDFDALEWEGASEISGFGPDENSKIYFFLTKEKLYIGGIFYFEKEQKPVIAYGADRDSAVWNEESIEFFLDSNRDYKSVHQVVFSAAGTVFDYLSFDKDWDGDIEVKTKVGLDRWTLESSLPVKDLFPGGVSKGDIYGMNVLRNSPGSSWERVRWSECKSRNHNAHLYGYIIIR